MPVAMLISFALAAATEPTYQVAPPSPVAKALNAPQPAPSTYPDLNAAPTVRVAETTLAPGQLRIFGPAPRNHDFMAPDDRYASGPYACNDKACKVRTPAYNTQPPTQREPDGRDHY
ncbi:MAG TPA: hypothetical protein VN042_13775 [Asticcacaulis sp.]|nr:hypothetical protein [Asticcacaulis sp.]